MKVLLTEYIDIAEIFLPIKKLTYLTLDQHLPYHLLVEDEDHDKNMHKPKKLFSIHLSLDNLIDDALNIVNKFLKEI